MGSTQAKVEGHQSKIDKLGAKVDAAEAPHAFGGAFSLATRFSATIIHYCQSQTHLGKLSRPGMFPTF